jgi:hypothetical protein
MVCSAFDKIPLGAEPKLLVPCRTAILFPTFVSAHADLIFGDVFPTVGDILEGHLRVRRATRSASASWSDRRPASTDAYLVRASFEAGDDRPRTIGALPFYMAEDRLDRSSTRRFVSSGSEATNFGMHLDRSALSGNLRFSGLFLLIVRVAEEATHRRIETKERRMIKKQLVLARC